MRPLFLAVTTFMSIQTTSALAQSTPENSGAQQSGNSTIESVIVTGTRRTQRSVFDSSAPIDVLSFNEINNTASEDLSDVMAQLVPSYKVQRLPMADGQVFVRPATLRGLSPDHTLVLVNGKRRHRSALLGGNGAQSPDLAQIPTFSIGRVEVLRDGASAQYGSDAIAGVINIILDESTNFRSFAQYSEYAEGDGENTRFGIKGGDCSWRYWLHQWRAGVFQCGAHFTQSAASRRHSI